MVSARADTLIARPREAVFSFIAEDFYKNYPRWSPEVQRLEVLSPGPLRVGSQARQVRIDRGRRTESTFAVVVCEGPRLLAFAERSNQFHISYRLDPAGADTRLTFAFELVRMDLFMRPFKKLIRLVVQEGAERVVRDIKNLVELEVPA
jgi:hypothetical protein